MKSWRETAQIFREIETLLAAGRAGALATLVKLEGSGYRRPGAKLLIREDGSVVGQVSGGCLENDLRERALRQLANRGEPELVHYDTGGDEDTLWGLGLGCNGKLDVFIQRIAPDDPVDQLPAILERLSGIEAFALRTLLDGREAGRISLGPPFTDERSGIMLDGDGRMFVDHLEPPPDVVIVGAGDDAIPLVRLATEAGFRVTLVDHRASYATAARFPDAASIAVTRPESAGSAVPGNAQTYAVIMNHALTFDKAWAARFAATAAPYIGLLGPARRRDEILAGLPPESHARIHGPIGLDIGADDAAQIAISIVAEILAVDGRRSAGFLRGASSPLHA